MTSNYNEKRVGMTHLYNYLIAAKRHKRDYYSPVRVIQNLNEMADRRLYPVSAKPIIPVIIRTADNAPTSVIMSDVSTISLYTKDT